MPSKNSLVEKHITDLSHLGRWKLHGVPSYAGPVAVYAILEQKKWKVHEILYFSPKHCIFLAESKGDDSPMCFAHGIHRKQLRFEAINAVAKKQQAESSQASRASSTSKPMTSSQESANQFWKKAASEAVALKREQPAKRDPPGPTGNTPEKKEARQT